LRKKHYAIPFTQFYFMKFNKNKLFPSWLPALIIMLVIFAFSSLPSDSMPSFDWADLLVKKGGHMLGYGLLALAYLYAFKLHSSKLKLAWLFAFLYALTDEFHQSFVVGRYASWLDVGIDSVGAAIALFWANKKIS